jgi:cell division initiation protein
MSATELDVPLLPNAEQIRRRMFASVRRGFDPDQVRDYLRQVADQVGTLEREVREARLQAEAALQQAASRSGRDPYAELGERLAEVIRAADQQAASITRAAKEQADRLVSEARAEADRVRLDAQSKAEEARQSGEEALRGARAEAERTLSELVTRKGSLVEQLASMQERLLAVAKDLDGAIGSGDPLRISVGADPLISNAGTHARGSARDILVDPRYEDLWASGDELTIEDMPPLDLDLGED